MTDHYSNKDKHKHIVWHEADSHSNTQPPLSVSPQSTHTHVKYAMQDTLQGLTGTSWAQGESKRQTLNTEFIHFYASAMWINLFVTVILTIITHISHFQLPIDCRQFYDNDNFERRVNLNTCFSVLSWLFIFHIALKGHWVTTISHSWPVAPLSLGVSAPFPADLYQNVSFSPRLCCLFYRSLSLCCERLRLLVMEVNLTNLWISPICLVFFPLYSTYFMLILST